MSRTGIPTLKFLLLHLVRYANRNLYRFQVNMTAPQYVCLQSLLTAAEDCLALL